MVNPPFQKRTPKKEKICKRDTRTRMVKNCTECGKEIYFKKNSSGKFIPFSKTTNNCHFEECNLKPKSETPKHNPFSRLWKPRGISYKTIRSNTTLDQFNKKNA